MRGDPLRPSSFLISILLLFALTIDGAVQAADESGQVSAGKTSSAGSIVKEPVFRGDFFLKEAGKGHAETIVLVHGIGDEAARVWDGIIPLLARKYHVVTFDLPGFGRSQKQNLLYSPGMYSRFLKWIVDTYATGPVIMMGHSMGGGITLRFGADYPSDLSRIILVDAAGVLHRATMAKYMLQFQPKEGWRRLLASPSGFLNGLAGSIIDDMEFDGLPANLDFILRNEVLRKVVLQSKPMTIAGLALAQEDFSGKIEQIRTPVNIIWGDEDGVAPPRTAALLSARLPYAGLRIIEGAGHVPILEKAAIFNAMVMDILASPPPAGNSSPSILPPPGDREGFCSGRERAHFTGSYKSIKIVNCHGAVLSKVSARYIEIVDSVVTIEESRITGEEGPVLRVVNSRVTGTAFDAEGTVAISASSSSFDLAGVALKGREAALISDDKVRVVFSVSSLSSPHSYGYMHKRFVVTPENPL